MYLLPFLLTLSILLDVISCSPSPMEGNNELPSTQAGGSGGGGRRPRRRQVGSSSRRPLRLFGNEFTPEEEVIEVEGEDEEVKPSSPLTIHNHLQRFMTEYHAKTPEERERERQQRHEQMDRSLIEHHIGELLQKPRLDLPFPEQVKQQAMVKVLQKYNLKMIHPHTMTISRSASRHYNPAIRDHIIGHRSNQPLFRAWIDKKWPLDSPLTQEQVQDRYNAEWTLYRSQQAMRYLNLQEKGAIYHSPSGLILLNPNYDLNAIEEVIDRYNKDELPRLTFTDRLHFKKSRVDKERRRDATRGGNGRPLTDETSSEEEKG